MKSDKHKQVMLITDDSLQSSLLKDLLESKLKVSVRLLTPEEMVNEGVLSGEYHAIIVDYSIVTEDFHSGYFEFIERNTLEVREIIFNCDKEIAIDELYYWTQLVGIFYITDSIDVLHHGVERILAGEMWFSRRVSQQIITMLRQHARPMAKQTNAKLTKREQQIITLLSLGNSNQQIAKKLFVSENTVKTHLHNIFKKIEVKNRVQALIWAKENLGIATISH